MMTFLRYYMLFILCFFLLVMFFQPCSCVSSGLTLIPAKIVSWQRIVAKHLIMITTASYSSLSSFSSLLLIPLTTPLIPLALLCHPFHPSCSPLYHSSHPSCSYLSSFSSLLLTPGPILLILLDLLWYPFRPCFSSRLPIFSSLSVFSIILVIPFAHPADHYSHPSLHLFHSFCSSPNTHSSHLSSLHPYNYFCSSPSPILIPLLQPSFLLFPFAHQGLIHPSHNAVSIPSLLVIPLVLLINVPHYLTHLLVILVTHYLRLDSEFDP
jgi:hypothetical protein